MFNQKPKPDGVSGSGPIAGAPKSAPPPFKNNPATPQDDPVVQCAQDLYDCDLEEQEQDIQTKGSQKGFTKTTVEGIVNGANNK